MDKYSEAWLQVTPTDDLMLEQEKLMGWMEWFNRAEGNWRDPDETRRRIRTQNQLAAVNNELRRRDDAKAQELA